MTTTTGADYRVTNTLGGSSIAESTLLESHDRSWLWTPSWDAGEEGTNRDREDDDQSWFWTASWQAGEQEADRDKAEGRIIDLSPEDIQVRIRALDT